MANKAYIGVNNIAKEVKKIYIGVGGVAKKVKKGYIGVNGVAKLFFGSANTINYYGTITPLSVARSGPVAITIGSYALFAGGSNTNKSDCVDAYNSSFTRTSPTSFTIVRAGHAAALSGNYAVFAGGFSNSTYLGSLEVYDLNLTHTYISAPSQCLWKSVTSLAAASLADHAIFNGGKDADSVSSTTTIYDASLTRANVQALNLGRKDMAAAATASHALFCGGQTNTGSLSSSSDVSLFVDSYDTSFTRSSLSNLSTKRTSAVATSIGDNVLIGGGRTYSSYEYYTSSVEYYDASLTRHTLTDLNRSVHQLAASTVGGFALFAGGQCGGAPNTTDVVNVYDSALTLSLAPSLSVARNLLAATTLGDCILIGGGSDASYTDLNTVDVYTLS